MDTSFIIEKIGESLPGMALQSKVDMAAYCSFRTGGPAGLLAEPGDVAQLQILLGLLKETRTPYFVMGNGTNVLVRGGGYHGVIVRMGRAFEQVAIEGNKIRAGAGALLSTVANRALEAGLTGFEFAAGIPGSIGGAAFMNAGAYDGEMKQVVEQVKVLFPEGQETLSAEEMQYGYRHSILMEREGIVLEALLTLEPGDPGQIREKMKDLAARRTAKQPLQYPSAGSFFKRPPGHFAGGLIQDAGLKGLALGGARVSPLHAGFIINENNATAEEIINLMEIVQNTVYHQFGVRLEPEVRIIGEEAD